MKRFLLFPLILALFTTVVYAQVNELNNFRYAYYNSNGDFVTTSTPVDQVNYIGYVCTSNNCRTVSTAGGTMFDGIARNAGAQTNNYVFTYPTTLLNLNGYGVYLYKPGYITYEIKSNWAGVGTVGPYNRYLSKVQECRAPIEQLTVLNDVQPNVPLLVGVNASLDSTVFSPLSNSGPLDYTPPQLVDDYYSVKVNVTLTIYNYTGDIAFEENTTLLIPFSGSKRAEFTWTPTVAGTYLARAVTNVPDPKCLSSQEEDTEKNFHVLSDEPRNMCYTLLNGIGLSDQSPDPGEDLTIHAFKTSNYADDNYLLTPIPTNTTIKVTKNDGTVVFQQAKQLAANPNSVDATYFEYVWSIPSDAPENYTITIDGIGDSILCNGTNLMENISVGTSVKPLPNTAPVLQDIPDKNIDEDATPPSDWIDLWAYAEDGESTDDQLVFTIVSQSNPSLINCRIEQNRYINCDNPALHSWGSSTITVEVSDRVFTDRDSFTIFVDKINYPPVLDPIGDKAVNEGHLLQFQINAVDFNNDSLTYSALDLPAGAKFNSTTKLFSWVPDYDQSGEYFVTFNVTDGVFYDSETIKIIVLDVCVDSDLDGYYAISINCPGSNDCDDGNAAVNPGAAELCDGNDNDCDGLTDENFINLGNVCTTGLGVCLANGNFICKQDGSGTECDAVPGQPTGNDDDCNGIDENCDGAADDNYIPTATSCGQGICAANGQLNCVNGATQDSCTAGTPAAELCDGLDNDCDNIIDNGGNALCNDTSYCNGAEVCNGAAGCQAGNAIDCSGSNLPGIATCNNNPDNNPFTWDFFAGFNSVCDEVNDICTTGTVTLTNTCDKTLCNAPCETNSHCDDSKSYTTDICVLASCTCSNQISDLKIISEPVTTFTPADEKYTSTYEYDVDAVGPNLGISYTLLQGPSGMTINTVSGLITWVPKEPGIYFVEVKAEDGVLSDTQSYYLQVQSPPKDTLPREKFFIGWIRTNQLVYDEIKAGDLLFVDLSFENIGRENTKYATIRITQPELGISRKLGPFVGPEIDEVMSRGTYLEIPGDAKPGVYTVRISLSDLSGMRRTRHRDFRIV